MRPTPTTPTPSFCIGSSYSKILRLEVHSLLVNHLLRIETYLNFGCARAAHKLEFLLVCRHDRLASCVFFRKMEDDCIDSLSFGSTHDFRLASHDSFF